MKRVFQFCVDTAQASGVRCFCHELSRALNEAGRIESRVVGGLGELAALAGEGSPGVLHLHGLWRRPLHAAAAWARRRGMPVVWSTHGMTAPWSMRHKRWKKLPAWWLYQKRDLLRAAALHVTTELEASWNRGIGLGGVRQVLAPLGTVEDGASCASLPAGPSAAKFVLLFVGRLYPVKGLPNLLRAVKLAESMRPDGLAGWEVRLVGPDEGGHRAELEQLCARLGLGNVVFAGVQCGAALSAEYRGCDVLVLPSFTENFGGVVVDALAHGKPVIASTRTPWRELRERRCGWWVDNAPEPLAQALVAAADAGAESRRAMGLRGRALVAEKYTWAAVAKAMAACYEEVGKANEG